MKALFIIFLTFPVVCLAHGVRHMKIEGGVGVEVQYEDVEGTPMSYSDVKIYSPENREEIFQEGITDKNGRFVFFPDKAGKWKIEINDGMGHGVITDVSVGEGLKLERKARGYLARWQKILVGLSLIIGITGILFYFSARRYMTGGKDAYS